ncbi:hypothetical protein, partial [Alicyclobacillus mali (ex Roth et al. 2021)]|uniref:hypothetical protein n=1 Tax=Alicyclobacillus mali (ex Roth et al. 2021) TaxID=1123961 RepID=UPI001A90A897
HTAEKDFYGMSYLSREVCVVFARDGISHSAKGSFIYNERSGRGGVTLFASGRDDEEDFAWQSTTT